MALHFKATESLELITSAAGTIHVQVSFDEATVDANGFVVPDTYKPDDQNTIITGATTTPILTAPATLRHRKIKEIMIRNVHASILNDVTPQHVGTVSTVQLIKVTLNPNDSLSKTENGLWSPHEAGYGGIKTAGLSAATDTQMGLVKIASQATQEAGADLVDAVTSGRQHFHPSAVKAWGKLGVAANIIAGYNLTSTVDTGTGVVTVNIDVDFSSANWAAVPGVEATATTWAVANAREVHVRSATQTAGVVALDCIDNTVTTCLVKDPTVWHLICCGDR